MKWLLAFIVVLAVLLLVVPSLFWAFWPAFVRVVLLLVDLLVQVVSRFIHLPFSW